MTDKVYFGMIEVQNETSIFTFAYKGYLAVRRAESEIKKLLRANKRRKQPFKVLGTKIVELTLKDKN